MASVLEINGVTVNRPASRLTIDIITISLDSVTELEFVETGVKRPGWVPGDTIELTVDGTPRFTGKVVSHHSSRSNGVLSVSYRCLDQRDQVDKIVIQNPNSLTGEIVFNLPTTDPEYLSDMDGFTLGQIIAYLLDAHATALTAAGITSYNTGDLSALTDVPPEPVRCRGRLWSQICDLVTTYANQCSPFITPGGEIRVVDVLAFTPVTLTLDADPIEYPQWSRNTAGCASRVVYRGGPNIDAAYVDLVSETLVEYFSSGDKTAWSLNDFSQPGNAADAGLINSMTSTVLTVESADPDVFWSTNFLSGIDAEIWAFDPLNGSTIGFSENRKITACTALTAGGTSDITVDRPFDNSYTNYQIIGNATASGSDTWRLYQLTNTYVGGHLVKNFCRAYPWVTGGSLVSMVSTPVASIVNSDGVEVPAFFEIIPSLNSVRFTKPTVQAFGTPAKLVTGGATTDGIPANIRVLVPFSRGPLEAVYPPNDTGGNPQFNGTLYTVDDIARTEVRNAPQWVDVRDQAKFNLMAEQLWKCISNTEVSGSLVYYGLYSAGLNLGQKLNVAQADGVVIGLESVNAPVRSVTLAYSGAAGYTTTLNFSTKLRPWSGESLYQPQSWGRGSARESFTGPASFSAYQGSLGMNGQSQSQLGGTGVAAGTVGADPFGAGPATGNQADFLGDNRALAPGSAQREFSDQEILGAGRAPARGPGRPKDKDKAKLDPGDPRHESPLERRSRESDARQAANQAKRDRHRANNPRPTTYDPAKDARLRAEEPGRQATKREQVRQADRANQQRRRALGNTTLQGPGDPNLGKAQAPSDYIRNLGMPKAPDSPEERERIANLGKRTRDELGDETGGE